MSDEIVWRNSRDTGGASTREFTITPRGGRKVTGALWLPKSASSGRTLIVCGHGASGDRYQDPIPRLARRFADEAGLAVLSMDGPVHGLRQVGPGGRAAFLPEIQRPTAIDEMVAEWQVAIGAAQHLPEVGTGPLAYFGLSMGSIFGIPLVASRDDVAVATFGLIGSSGAVGHLGERLLADARKIICPLAFLMQLEDEIFDRTGCLALFDALASRDKRMHANPGLHPAVPVEEIDFAFEFMRAHIEGRGERRLVYPLAE